MALRVETLVNGSFEENSYLLYQDGGSEAILVDPGADADSLLQAAAARGVKPVLLLATHGHYDHVGAAQAVAQATGAAFAMARGDEPLLESLEDTLAFHGVFGIKRPQVGRWLKAGETVDAAGIRLNVLGTPGHTPGGLCFYHAESGSLFSGDTLFAGTVGRSDMEGGSHEQLIASIRRELLVLPDATKVYPGHGEASTLGRERRENRFLK